MRVCHLLPALPPAMDGIGDYAVGLADELRTQYGVENLFLVGNPQWRASPGSPASAVAVETRSPEALIAALDRMGDFDILFLHQVGYGYDSQGLPFWLVKGLETAIKERARTSPQWKLVILFHELWATGPFWKKAFYTIGWQKALVRRLLRLASISFTTTHYYHRLLLRETKRLGEPIPIFGIPYDRVATAIPESSESQSSFGLRPLIFGLQWNRLLALRTHRNLLKQWQRSGKIERLLLVGKKPSETEYIKETQYLKAAGLESCVERRYDLDSVQIGQAFAESNLYLSGYPAILICKSTTLLAAMAQGCAVLPANDREAAPLEPNRHFISRLRAQEGALTDFDLKKIGNQGKEWWRAHATVSRVAEQIYRLLQSV